MSRRVTFVLLSLLLAATAAPSRAAGCDRECLGSMVDQYLDALQAHDPARLPLARGARYTENTVPLAPGDGFWQTIDAGSVSATSRLVITDPATSQVAFYGAAKESGHGVLFSLRLKHRGGRITEIEQFVARRGPAQIGEFDQPPPFEAAWNQPVPAAGRASRDELARIANLYFDGIEQANGEIVPVVPETSRVENGFRTAPRPPEGSGLAAMSIRESFNSGMFRYIREIRPRRVLLADEERGIVHTMVMFQHPGNVKLPFWEKQYADPTSIIVYPNTIGIFESFKVQGGKITHITAQMVILPYRQGPGWPLR
jgi:hypothetical protein